MQIFYRKSFLKALKVKLDEVLDIFEANPFDISLKNHALKGTMKNLRSFSVTGDLRVVYQPFKDHSEVILINVGTHSRLYG